MNPYVPRGCGRREVGDATTQCESSLFDRTADLLGYECLKSDAQRDRGHVHSNTTRNYAKYVKYDAAQIRPRCGAKQNETWSRVQYGATRTRVSYDATPSRVRDEETRNRVLYGTAQTHGWYDATQNRVRLNANRWVAPNGPGSEGLGRQYG